MITMSQAIDAYLNTLDQTMNNEPDPITEKCPHCGAVILTSRGLWLQTMRAEQHPELEAIPDKCTCKGAQEARERAVATLAEQRAAGEAKRRTKARQRLFEASGMPAAWERRSLRDWNATTFDEQKALDIAKEALSAAIETREIPSLYIVGTVGTGKTMLASCLARDLHRAEKPAMWSSVGAMLSDIKAAFGSREITEQEVLGKYQTTPLLVLDDMGKEKATIWSTEQLFRVIDARYNNELPTIVTSNYNSRGLLERLTPQDGSVDDKETAVAIVDRLLGTCTPIKLTGASKRRRAF